MQVASIGAHNRCSLAVLQRRKKRGYKQREWWKRCRDITTKIFGTEDAERQGKKEENKSEIKRKTNGILGEWENVFLFFDDREKFKRS